MRRILYIASLLTIFALLASAASQQSAFDAATVKLNKSPNAGGPFGFVDCHGADTKVSIPRPSPTPLGRCAAVRISLQGLIRLIYFRADRSTPIDQLIYGGPAWIAADLWDIEGVSENPAKTSEATLWSMLETLVAGRFKLQFHHETRQIQGFTLSIAKSGSKLKPAAGGAPSMVAGADRSITALNQPMQRLVSLLAARIGGQVTDQTGLTGVYDFTLTLPSIEPQVPTADSSAPSIFTAVQEQLGLKLESQKTSVDVLVIDHVERPPNNGGLWNIFRM